MAVASDLNDDRNVQRIGKKISKPMPHARTVQRVFFRVVMARAMMRLPPQSRFLPTTRMRKIATMLARMTATMPPAEPRPMLWLSRTRW